MNEPPEVDSAAENKVLRLILVAVVLIGVVLAVQLTPLRGWVTNLQKWKLLLDSWGLAGHAVFATAAAGLVAIGVPRLAVAGLAGTLLGFAEGFTLAQIATVTGSYVAFLFVRLSGSQLPGKSSGKMESMRNLVAHPSVGGVFFSRLLPLPAVVQNALLAMSSVGHGTFLAGTFLGYLPTNLAVTLMGSAMGKDNASQSVTQLVTAVCLLGAMAVFFMKRFKKNRQPTDS